MQLETSYTQLDSSSLDSSSLYSIEELYLIVILLYSVENLKIKWSFLL